MPLPVPVDFIWQISSGHRRWYLSKTPELRGVDTRSLKINALQWTFCTALTDEEQVIDEM